MQDIQLIEIDLFCGAGGVTTGSEKARINGNKVCKVIACVNHDEMAIQSHAANHEQVYHFTEDIRTMNLKKLLDIVNHYRTLYPRAKLLLWASLECTNFSKAKGGLPREADSRTLAESLYRYIEILNPDLIYIENVEEFMSWGPLDEKGKPISRNQGQDYMRWVNKVKSYGYEFDHRIMVCADYGDYTTRKRFFGQFVKFDIPISWPTPTHAKKARADMFGSFKQWKPVRDVLDLEDEGKSIFDRKIPLCDKSLERILAGCKKFAIKGENTFISKYFSGHPESKNRSINQPINTITTIDHHAVVNTSFLAKYFTGGGQLQSIETPASTLTTKDRISLVNAQFIDKQYGVGSSQSLNQPAATLTKIPKLNLVSVKHHYLLDAQFGNTGKSINEPAPTIIARQDKKPMYLISSETGNVEILINNSDSAIMRELKTFMNQHGICDIKMRMLKINELLRITGFPQGYILKGSQADQKKFIGNAVPIETVKAWIEETCKNLMQLQAKGVA